MQSFCPTGQKDRESGLPRVASAEAPIGHPPRQACHPCPRVARRILTSVPGRRREACPGKKQSKIPRQVRCGPVRQQQDSDLATFLSGRTEILHGLGPTIWRSHGGGQARDQEAGTKSPWCNLFGDFQTQEFRCFAAAYGHGGAAPQSGGSGFLGVCHSSGGPSSR